MFKTIVLLLVVFCTVANGGACLDCDKEQCIKNTVGFIQSNSNEIKAESCGGMCFWMYCLTADIFDKLYHFHTNSTPAHNERVLLLLKKMRVSIYSADRDLVLKLKQMIPKFKGEHKQALINFTPNLIRRYHTGDDEMFKAVFDWYLSSHGIIKNNLMKTMCNYYIWGIPKSQLNRVRNNSTFQDYYLKNEIGIKKPLRKKINSNQLKILNQSYLRILRNSIFAKYGRQFKDKSLQNYFKTFNWYKPSADYKDKLLTKIDKRNLKIVLREEKSRNTKK